ncbi:hypothetical protein FRB99_007561 [Tulasnella sp. 403]|nr:hypothetical protein FRB99_007561 [Tulasnella sp. 403]
MLQGAQETVQVSEADATTDKDLVMAPVDASLVPVKKAPAKRKFKAPVTPLPPEKEILRKRTILEEATPEIKRKKRQRHLPLAEDEDGIAGNATTDDDESAQDAPLRTPSATPPPLPNTEPASSHLELPVPDGASGSESTNLKPMVQPGEAPPQVSMTTANSSAIVCSSPSTSQQAPTRQTNSTPIAIAEGPSQFPLPQFGAQGMLPSLYPPYYGFPPNATAPTYYNPYAPPPVQVPQPQTQALSRPPAIQQPQGAKKRSRAKVMPASAAPKEQLAPPIERPQESSLAQSTNQIIKSTATLELDFTMKASEQRAVSPSDASLPSSSNSQTANVFGSQPTGTVIPAVSTPKKQTGSIASVFSNWGSPVSFKLNGLFGRTGNRNTGTEPSTPTKSRETKLKSRANEHSTTPPSIGRTTTITPIANKVASTSVPAAEVSMVESTPQPTLPRMFSSQGPRSMAPQSNTPPGDPTNTVTQGFSNIVNQGANDQMDFEPEVRPAKVLSGTVAQPGASATLPRLDKGKSRGASSPMDESFSTSTGSNQQEKIAPPDDFDGMIDFLRQNMEYLQRKVETLEDRAVSRRR